MLIWKEEYSIGMDLIDQQHQYLFEIGNNAYKLLKNEKGDNQFNNIALIIQDLRNYTKFHFQTEEEYMVKINYKEYAGQKKEHDEFIHKLDRIDLEQIKNDPQKFMEDILVFIFDWLLDHILKKDKLIMSGK